MDSVRVLLSNLAHVEKMYSVLEQNSVCHRINLLNRMYLSMFSYCIITIVDHRTFLFEIQSRCLCFVKRSFSIHSLEQIIFTSQRVITPSIRIDCQRTMSIHFKRDTFFYRFDKVLLSPSIIF